MNRLVRVVVLCLALLAGNNSFAQETTRTISGVVTNSETGQPLAGASVSVKGSRGGAFTKEDGSFALAVDASAKKLQVSYAGYEVSETELGASSQYDIQLKSTTRQLEDVIVT